MAHASNKVRGRPPHERKEADVERIERMVAYGFTQEQIAGVLGISHPTLRKHYADALEHGKARVIENVANSLYDVAVSGDVQAQKFFLSARGNWTEKQQTEHSGSVEVRSLQVDFVKPGQSG
jgi:hypothetical protein